MYAAVFIGSAIGGHFMNMNSTAQYAEARGNTNAPMKVSLAGLWILAAGIMIVFGIWTDIGFLMAMLWCLVSAVFVHHFWTDEGMIQQIEMSMFMKNLSIAGAGLILFILFAWARGAIGLQLVGPYFEITSL
jgi:uncharacterized membrane protein YphA (DoxX/SURF4 family)